MPHLSAEAKHHILLEYDPYNRYRSFAALARKHNVAGGRETVERWFHRWDRTPSSLEECPRTGRPRVLSVDDVHELVAPIIRRANRENRVIDYAQVADDRPCGQLANFAAVRPLRRRSWHENNSTQCGRASEHGS